MMRVVLAVFFCLLQGIAAGQSAGDPYGNISHVKAELRDVDDRVFELEFPAYFKFNTQHYFFEGFVLMEPAQYGSVNWDYRRLLSHFEWQSGGNDQFLYLSAALFEGFFDPQRHPFIGADFQWPAGLEWKDQQTSVIMNGRFESRTIWIGGKQVYPLRLNWETDFFEIVKYEWEQESLMLRSVRFEVEPAWIQEVN